MGIYHYVKSEYPMLSQENHPADLWPRMVAEVGLPFYFGSIYGSTNAAGKGNAAVNEKHLDKIRNTLG